MKKLSSVGLFILFFLTYHIIGSSFFPIDEKTNVLLAPDWYPIVGIALSILFVVLFWKIAFIIKRRKQDKSVDFYDAAQVVFETGMPSESILERKLNISYKTAAKLMKELEAAGIVSSLNEGTPRRILASLKNFQNGDSGVQSVSAVDGMDGHEFEYWCADLLRDNGFANVEVTQGSGDQGVDVLAEKDGIKYAIQCKCYSSDLGNKPVQEVNTGKEIYHCHIGAVMTNRFFTPGAKQAADATGTLLWDRDKLSEFIENAHRG